MVNHGRPVERWRSTVWSWVCRDRQMPAVCALCSQHRAMVPSPRLGFQHPRQQFFGSGMSRSSGSGLAPLLMPCRRSLPLLCCVLSTTRVCGHLREHNSQHWRSVDILLEARQLTCLPAGTAACGGPPPVPHTLRAHGDPKWSHILRPHYRKTNRCAFGSSMRCFGIASWSFCLTGDPPSGL